MGAGSPSTTATESAAGAAAPCRPYWPGEHARALRTRILTGLGLGLLAALVVPSLLRAVLLTVTDAPLGGSPAPGVATVVGLIDDFGFSITAILVAWLWVGARRWDAIEILVWGSQYPAAGYAAVTGIRDPTDAEAAAAWLRANPAPPDEAPEVVYWRAHAQFVSRDLDGARSTVQRLAAREDYRFAIASLDAQIAMAQGVHPDLGAVESALPSGDGLERAIAAANLGALRAQDAWRCGTDDIAAARSVRPLMGRHGSNFLLLRLWLPALGLTLIVSVLIRLLGTS